jgi:beta-galactosidase/beta-glucuronidase
MLTLPVSLLALAALASAPPTWSPAAGPLQTRWTAGVVAAATGPAPTATADSSANNASGVWNTYPRPQFARSADTWQSLNGLWEYAIRVRPMDGSKPGPNANAQSTPLTFPSRADGTILVPFPAESQLSGVGKPVPADSELFYRRSFDIATDYKAAGARTVLHFGAVDWFARVSVNGKTVGEHAGGFDAFSFDITDFVKPGANELVVSAWDPTDSGTQPRGKQVRKPEGIFYTAVTGIWQTVWLERVPGLRVQSFVAETDRKTGSLAMQIALEGDTKSAGALTIQVLAPNGTEAASIKVAPPEARLSPRILLPDIRAWSPDSPALYDIVLTLTDKSGAVSDRVRTYCAFRDVAVVRDGDGPARIELNGKPIFMLGLLDQGWWPDGLLTPPSHEAMVYDLQATLDCGFNTIRKHVKVEPATWYAACDRLGILVWQDMPSGDKSIGPNDADMTRTDASARAYERELAAMVEQLRPFPSVVLWVPFNEGWGQFDSARITDSVRSLDATRIVITASGWSDRNTGDVFDVHDYAPRVAGRVPTSTGGRAWVIGECGGFGLPMPGHLWASSGWGYTSYKDCDALTRAYEQLAADLLGLRAEGLCAAIYTQTTDVETEVNGLMTAGAPRRRCAC